MAHEKYAVTHSEIEFYMTKEEWGDGPWLSEPGMDHIEYFDYKGFPCALTRNSTGSWNGYVGISRRSPWRKDCDSLEVHGGVTYSSIHLPWDDSKLGKLKLFWIGFDTSHYCDYWPRTQMFIRYTRKTNPNQLRNTQERYDSIDNPQNYKTLEFCKEELRKLINQIDPKD